MYQSTASAVGSSALRHDGRLRPAAAHRRRRRLPRLQGPAAAPALPMAAQPTSVGDSAAYERRAVSCDDVVIVSACRTALCKAKRGGFKVR